MRRAVAWVPLLLTAWMLSGCSDDDDDDFFFISASSTADLNIDGFADLVVGAPLDDGAGAAGSERGAVFIHLGSLSGPSAAPDLTIFGAEDRAHFGASLALVGDINGAGAPDLLIGAPFDDADNNTTNGNTDRGRAFIFFGGPQMDAIADVTMSGAESGALLGSSVGWVG